MNLDGTRTGLAILLVELTLSSAAKAAPVGTTIDYRYGDLEWPHPAQTWRARAYLPGSTHGSSDAPRPLVVFLHGVNPKYVDFAGMGGGDTDLRQTADALIEAGSTLPFVLAAPSSVRDCTLPQALWTGFDLDRFVDSTVRATMHVARIDLQRIIVVGHSGAGCNQRGGLITALQSSLPVLAGLAVDVCMSPYDARAYEASHQSTRLIFAYQSTWERDFAAFSAAIRPPAASRTSLIEVPLRGLDAHRDILPYSLMRWLPELLPVKR